MIVFTSSADNLKRIVDAALDGSNLTGSPNFKTTMSALPDQSVAAFYIDLNEYMDAYFKMMTAQSAYQSEVFDRIYTSVMTGTNSNDADRQKQIEEAQQQQAANAQQLRDMLSAMGGMGAVMTYEPTGIRFDIAEQLDPGRLPEKWRTLYGTNLTPADNRVFDSIPASAIIAINGHNPGAALGAMLDPGYLSMLLSNMPGITGEEIAGKIADFEKLAGVDLKSDLLDLLNGDMAFVMLPKARAVAQPKNPYFFSWPFDLALMLDSSDATKVSGSLDKLIQTALVAANDRSTKLQPMDRTPYSTLIDANGNTVLSYGAVEGRWVIGSDPDTLDAIGNAAKAPLSADETFKAATALLPTDRASTGYVQLSALWDWIVSLSGDTACDACDYLRPFKWISIANEVPANGLSKGSMHIRIEATR